MDFRHATSSPGYPQSNGLAEKTVQTAKNILSRAKAEGSDPRLVLLEYRSIPVDKLAFPAQLQKGRQLRSILPSAAKHQRPMTVNPTMHHQKAASTDNTKKCTPTLLHTSCLHCSPATRSMSNFKGGQVNTCPGNHTKQYPKIIPGTD